MCVESNSKQPYENLPNVKERKRVSYHPIIGIPRTVVCDEECKEARSGEGDPRRTVAQPPEGVT